MSFETIFQGSLFTSTFLTDSIRETDDWASLDDADIDRLAVELARIFGSFPTNQTPNETRTEDDLIWPILGKLGWSAFMRQQNLTARGRDDVPDGLLFANNDAKTRADRHVEEWRRYGHGLALVESKRWRRALDRRGERRGEELAPSTQVLRYLRRADDLTQGSLRWGILTNGGRWRLCYAGARSVSEQFLEIDLERLVGIDDDGLFALTDEERRHGLRIFALMFRRDAFLPSPADGRSFHLRAAEAGRFYERRVASNLSDVVFRKVYPLLARSIAGAAPAATLPDVREAALILLYRLLFILYAEDRNLLPVTDPRYDDYGLRDRVRLDVRRRKDAADTFSTSAARYWGVIDDLTRIIDGGDPSIGLPPYNGGLFNAASTPLLTRIRLSDAVMADAIDALSFERTGGQRRYINYRDLSVQQLGSIYERLLEYELVREEAGDDGAPVLDLRPNAFARKGSGSYYTPDDLVGLIVAETLDPLIARIQDTFRDAIDDGAATAALKRLDPASRILELKVCDPAMGSGHFLVNLVDALTDHILAAIAEAGALLPGDADAPGFISPLVARIETVRDTIVQNAQAENWTVDPGQLDDRHIVRRMVLKRCVYGVDKNAMAVELAKVSLWLHSFTVGAPLSFLDHHLRHGDSLFGSWVANGIAVARRFGLAAFLDGPMTRALGSAASMQQIEGLADAEIAEARRSAQIYDGVREMTAPLDAMLAFAHALRWLGHVGAGRPDRETTAVLQAFFDGEFGDPFAIAAGQVPPRRPGQAEADTALRGQLAPSEKLARFNAILDEARTLLTEEGFLNWQVAFPGLWQDWAEEGLTGGFDAVIGNPPWDRMKLQQVEWFAARRPEIARATRASERRRMVAALETDGDPLAAHYTRASARAEAAVRVARGGGDYPLMSGGDVNLYSLFVERAMTLVRPDGIVGLLVPSGIASDLTASRFFKGVATGGRLKALYDFENRRTRYGHEPFFPDVDSRFKFCAFVAGRSETSEPTQCAFFLQDVSELANPDRRFALTAEDFARVNPNTGTAPILRTRRDADLTTAIYARLPVLVDRSGPDPVAAWPVRYATMFHMTNDSGQFRTRTELEEAEGAFPLGGNRFGSPDGDWVPLYVGRMIQPFDHRAASVTVNTDNVHNAALSADVSDAQKSDPAFVPTPQYWVPEREVAFPDDMGWAIAFRDIARATDARTMISAVVPKAGFGNKLPLLLPTDIAEYRRTASLALANVNALVFDYVARSKIHSTSVNWYLFEQLPVVSPTTFESNRFGSRTAAEIVQEAVLELTYTAHDMAPFARDLGHVDAAGAALPPFVWDEGRRLRLRAKLDAVFFHLYGLTDRDDVRYVYSTFPIVERQETAEHGTYRSRDLCLAYMNALAAGRPDAEVDG